MKKRKGLYQRHHRSMAVFPSNINYTGTPGRPMPIRPFPLRKLFVLRAALAKPQPRLT